MRSMAVVLFAVAACAAGQPTNSSSPIPVTGVGGAAGSADTAGQTGGAGRSGSAGTTVGNNTNNNNNNMTHPPAAGTGRMDQGNMNGGGAGRMGAAGMMMPTAGMMGSAGSGPPPGDATPVVPALTDECPSFRSGTL